MSVPKNVRTPAQDQAIHPVPGAAPFRIAACVDTSAMARSVIAHAVAFAKALQAELTLIRVLETRPAGSAPADPVEWEIRRREARDSIARIAEEQTDNIAGIKAQVVEGHATEQIWLWARDHDVALTVFCTHGEDNVMGRSLRLSTGRSAHSFSCQVPRRMNLSCTTVGFSCRSTDHPRQRACFRSPPRWHGRIRGK